MGWIGWSPLVGSVKLSFDGCSLGNPNWMGIGGGIKDHFDTVLRAFSKQVRVRFDIEVEILALLEGLL